jgi:hypothetical protein
MQRKMIESANIWLPAIGSILLGGLAVGAWYGGNKIFALWSGFLGVVCLLLLVALQFQEFILKDAMSPSKADSPDRAWVSVETAIAGPLAYDDKGWDAGFRWHIPLNYELRNTGNTPAMGVEFYANILPFIIGHWPPDRVKDGVPQGPPIPGTDAAAELKKMCANVAAMSATLGPLVGRTLFRDKTVSGTFHINGNPTLFEAARQSQGYSGNFLILICVTYRFTSDEKLHQTGDAFALFKRVGNQKFDLDGETVPFEHLGFVPQPMGGSFAN